MKKGTGRPPIPGLETSAFLLERAYRWWQPEHPKIDNENVRTAAQSRPKGSAALARFRKAGQTVVRMRKVAMLQKPVLGRADTGARNADVAKRHRKASVQKLQNMLASESHITELDSTEAPQEHADRTLPSIRSEGRLRYQQEHGRRTAVNEQAIAIAARRAAETILKIDVHKKKKGKRRKNRHSHQSRRRTQGPTDDRRGTQQRTHRRLSLVQEAAEPSPLAAVEEAGGGGDRPALRTQRSATVRMTDAAELSAALHGRHLSGGVVED